MPVNSPSTKLYAALLLAMVFWGGGWPALKLLTQSISVEVVTFWRVAIMFALFIPIIAVLKKPVKVSKKAFAYIASSAALNVLFMFLAFYGVRYGLAGSGGVLVTTLSPLLTLLLLFLLHRQRSGKVQLVGIALGLLGGAIMMELWRFDAHAFFDSGNLFFLLAALTWAAITLISQRSHLHIHPLHYTFLLAATATVPLFFLALPHGILSVFSQGWEFWTAMLYLAVLGQTVASTIYFYAAGRLGSGPTSSFMFLVPLSALFISWVILGEEPSGALLFGGTLSILAVALVNRRAR